MAGYVIHYSNYFTVFFHSGHLHCQFTSFSWAFGVVLWEICTLGKGVFLIYVFSMQQQELFQFSHSFPVSGVKFFSIVICYQYLHFCMIL